MKLEKHICTRFLTDPTLAWEIIETTYPKLYENWKEDQGDENIAPIASLFKLVSIEGQRAYFITDTVMDKLDLLKVSRSSLYELTSKDLNTKEVIATEGNVTTYDWSVFNSIQNRKVTLIMGNNTLLRVLFDENYISWAFLEYTLEDWARNKGNLLWTLGFVDKNRSRVSHNWNEHNMQKSELLIYRLLCFIYLSENEEVVVEAGQKFGTKKKGKVINTMSVPVTIVTSKWNITSIRTEAFAVSGHFRLQPTKTGTKMIFINPFMKKGYVRKASNISNS